MLLLSYLIAWIARDLRQGAALDEGIISTALLHQPDVLLLAAAGVLFVLTVLGWIVNATRARRQPHAVRGRADAGMLVRQRPVRVSSQDDSDVYEPPYEPIARSGRFGQNVDATSPLSSGVSARPDTVAAPATNGHARFTVDDKRHRNGDAHSPAATIRCGQPGVPRRQRRASSSETTSRWPVASATGVTDDDRCAVCRAQVGPRDVFCPECGATL